MNKSELINYISEIHDVPKYRTELIIKDILTTIIKELSEGKEVKLNGFGSFKVKTRKQRKGRNPQTGEELIIPEHRVPVFKFSKNIKKYVNEKK